MLWRQDFFTNCGLSCVPVKPLFSFITVRWCYPNNCPWRKDGFAVIARTITCRFLLHLQSQCCVLRITWKAFICYFKRAFTFFPWSLIYHFRDCSAFRCVTVNCEKKVASIWIVCFCKLCCDSWRSFGSYSFSDCQWLPNCDYKRMTGFLLAHGRIRESMRCVDPEGVSLRALQLNRVNRRQYSVYSSLALWHIDTNHKLIR